MRDAEEFVRQAWGSALLGLRTNEVYTTHVAFKNCDAAYARLAAARRDGDPARISQTHTALQRALDTALTSAAERDRILEKVRAELDLLAGAANQHTSPTCVPPPEKGKPASTVQPPDPPDPSRRRPRHTPPTARPRRRLPPWLNHLTPDTRRREDRDQR